MANITQILKKLRNFDIRIRKLVNSQNQGSFDSIFKGSGIEFDDIRLYQYGDDIRAINWNVTAKGHGTFVKTFKEEKEQSIFFIVDVSASQKIGKLGQQKIDVAKEITGVLMLSAIREQSKVGLLAFSNQRELFVKSTKSNASGYRMIQQLFDLKPKSVKTDLNEAMDFTLKTLKKKSIVFLISDFIDLNLDKKITLLAQQHDLICIQLQDLQELNFPKLGIIPLKEVEHGKTVWVNTNSNQFIHLFSKKQVQNKLDLINLSKKHRFNFLNINTNEDFVPQLVRLFKTRNLIKKRA